MAPKKKTFTSADVTAAVDNLAKDVDARQSVRQSVATTSTTATINFRLPNPLLMGAILFGMYVTIALGAELNRNPAQANWITQVRDLFYFNESVTSVLNFINVNVAQYMFFGYQREALAFIAPAAVAAHVGEAVVALVKLVQARNTFGSQVCSIVGVVSWVFAVFLFGFGSLGLLGKEIRKLSKKQ